MEHLLGPGIMIISTILAYLAFHPAVKPLRRVFLRKVGEEDFRDTFKPVPAEDPPKELDHRPPCDFCGEPMEVTPESLIEGKFSIFPFGGEDPTEAWKNPDGGAQGLPDGLVTQEAMDELQEATGLTDEQVESLMRTGALEDTTMCICPKCLDEGMEEDPDGERGFSL